jgi:hypothetical protein
MAFKRVLNPLVLRASDEMVTILRGCVSRKFRNEGESLRLFISSSYEHFQ